MPTSTQNAPATRSGSDRGGLREVIVLAYPVILTQLSSTMLGVVDSAMVGRLGATELAAVGFGAVWMWTLFSLFFGTATAVQTFVSQADGAGAAQSCGRWAWQGLYVLVPVTALAAAALATGLGPAVDLLGTSPELRSATMDYVSARLAGEVGFTAVMVLNSFFRGKGDTRTPLYVSLVANAVNALLDYGLIFGNLGLPRWGVAGAGVATAVGQWLSAAILFAAFRRRRVSERFATAAVAPSRMDIRRLLQTGAPVGGQWCVGMTSFAVFTTLIASMGDASMAASQAFLMLLSLSFMQAIGISIASSTLVGRYVGAGDVPGVLRSYRSSLLLGTALAGIVAILFVTVPGPLLRIFTDDAAIVALGQPLLVLGALFQLFDAIAIISEGALRGAGDTRWPFLLETALGWGFFVPLAYGLGIALEGGLQGAWLGGLIYIVALALLLVRRFRSGAWRRIQI